MDFWTAIAIIGGVFWGGFFTAVTLNNYFKSKVDKEHL